MIIPNIWKIIKFMFQTTNQSCVCGYVAIAYWMRNCLLRHKSNMGAIWPMTTCRMIFLWLFHASSKKSGWTCSQLDRQKHISVDEHPGGTQNRPTKIVQLLTAPQRDANFENQNVRQKKALPASTCAPSQHFCSKNAPSNFWWVYKFFKVSAVCFIMFFPVHSPAPLVAFEALPQTDVPFVLFFWKVNCQEWPF